MPPATRRMPTAEREAFAQPAPAARPPATVATEPAPTAIAKPLLQAEPLSAAIMDKASRSVYTPIFTKPVVAPDLNRRLQPTADLRALINTVPSLSSKATTDLDGRKEQLVLLVAHDKAGEPVPNLVVRLVQGGQLRDQTRTDRRGVAILLLPHAAGHAAAATQPQPCQVEILARDRPTLTRPVSIPHGRQHQVMDVLIDPPVATSVPVLTDGERSASALHAAPLPPVVDLHYNPLDRLPADFGTELCQDLKNFFGPTEDPIFGLAGGTSDFRQRRIPLVKRMTVARIGATKPDKSAPRRYLVRLRQEWTFLGYTLGELVEAEPLDPGAILNEATRTVSRTTSSVQHAVDELVSRTLETTQSHLGQAATIDNLLQVSTSTRVSAQAGGFGMLLGPIGFGFANASAGVSTKTSVRNRTDTSLEVNSSLHVAKSVVNTAARTAQTLRRELQSTVTSTIERVSPLLSRVTNLLRWTLYENYMVCTHVEDVVEVVDVPIASLGSPGTPLFTDEQIVDLRRIFSPGLLEPRLRPQFDRLAAAVDARRGGELPITAVHVDVQYAQGFGASTLALRIGGDETTITLRQGATRASGVIRLNVPRDDSAITGLEATLTLSQLNSILGTVLIPNAASVSRIELGFQTASGFVRRMVVTPGDDLRATQDAPSVTLNASITIPPPAVFTEHNPLVVHVNNNRTYYFGLLCQAALLEPSLRDDLPHFEAFDSNHELWRLPIVGFEGNRALVVKDADRSLPEVTELLADPGAATLIQLAAPGAYAEALQGLLKLAVDTEKIHPSLLPAPAPVMAPLALVDMAGNVVPTTGGIPVAGGTTIPVVSDGGSGGTGGSTGGTGGLPLPLPSP